MKPILSGNPLLISGVKALGLDVSVVSEFTLSAGEGKPLSLNVTMYVDGDAVDVRSVVVNNFVLCEQVEPQCKPEN
jgi:hypothetical protein